LASLATDTARDAVWAGVDRGGAGVKAVASADRLSLVVASSEGDGSERTVGSSDGDGSGGASGSSLVAAVAPSPPPPTRAPLLPDETCRVRVDALCVGIQLHAAWAVTSPGREERRLRILLKVGQLKSILCGALPLIVRAGFGLPVFGSSTETQFIAASFLIFTPLCCVSVVSVILTGIADFMRRKLTLQMLGDLADRKHRLPKTAEGIASALAATPATHAEHTESAHAHVDAEGGEAALPLDSPQNVAAWLASRRLLKSVGLLYMLQANLATVAAVALALVQFAVTLIVLYVTPTPPIPAVMTPAAALTLSAKIAPTVVASVNGVLLLFGFLGLLIITVAEGAEANATAAQHGELAVVLQAEASRTAAATRAAAGQGGGDAEAARRDAERWDDVARLLSIVPSSLSFEPQLQVCGFDASFTLVNAIYSAIITGGGVVLGALQAKFGVFSLGS
jgi:hypothetical protein